MELSIHNKQMFNRGDRFQHINQGVKANLWGTVRYLRDDEYEINARISDPSHYYYYVDFDDGTFETYLNQMYMIHKDK